MLGSGLGALEKPVGASVGDQEGQKWGNSKQLAVQSVEACRQSWECLGAGDDNDLWLRSSAVAIDGIQLTGRSKSNVQTSPWELQLHDDTGYALHVAWVQVPGANGLQLFVLDGCARWSSGSSCTPSISLPSQSPSLQAWHLGKEPASSLNDGLVVVGVLLAPNCVSAYGADPCRTVSLPMGLQCAQLIPPTWLRRLVVLTRLEFGSPGSCALIEPAGLMVPRTAGSFTTNLKSIVRTWSTPDPLGLQFEPEGSEGGVLVAAVSDRVLTNLVGLAVSAVGGKDVSTCCVAEVARLVASPNRPLTIQFTQYVKSMAFVPATDVCCLDPVLVGGDVPAGAELGLSLVHEQFHDVARFIYASKPPTPKPTGPRQDSLNPKEITFGGLHIMMAQVHSLRHQLGAMDGAGLNIVDLGSAVGGVLLGLLVSEPLAKTVVGVELCAV